MTTDPNSPKAIELLETARKKRAVLEARLRKESLRSISDRMGVSVGTVRVWIKEMTQTYLPLEEETELRAQEAAGIDALEANAYTMLDWLMREGARREQNQESTTGIVDQMQRVQEHITNLKKRRAALLGLDTPVKIKHQVTVRTEFDAEVEELTSWLTGGGNLLTGPDEVDLGADSDGS